MVFKMWAAAVLLVIDRPELDYEATGAGGAGGAKHSKLSPEDGPEGPT